MEKQTKIGSAREYLRSEGFAFAGYGAMTKDEMWKRGNETAFIRRDRSGLRVCFG